MAVIYLFTPQLMCLGAYEPTSLVHSEASYQVKCEVKWDVMVNSGYCIGFKCIDDRFRLFEIDEIDFRDEPGDVYISGTDLAVRELTDIVVTDIRCNSMTVSAALEHLLEASGSGWTVGDVITTDAKTTRHYYKSLWEAVVSLMDSYGCRMAPYFLINDQGAITNRKIDILSTEPVYRGRLFESEDEASGVVVTIFGNPKTALYGRGKGVESGTTESGDTTYGPRLTFKDVVWSVANGDPCNKPLGQEWVGDEAAKIPFGRHGEHRYGVAIFEDETDPEALLQKTWDYLQTIKFPSVSASATIYDLEMVKGYSWAAVRLNDLILIRPKLYQSDVSATITKIDRDYINPANTKLEIASTTQQKVSASSLYSATTKKLDAVAQLEDRVITRDSVIDTMVTKIMSSGTTMYTDPTSGAFVFESVDGTSAMMLTGGGWMIADEKIGENWNWRTAATGNGIVADEITTGTLQASVVKIFGSDHFYWDADNIYIREGTGQEMALYGVKLKKTSGTVRQYYYNGDVSASQTRVTFWTNNQSPAKNSLVYVAVGNTTQTVYVNWYSPDGGSIPSYTFEAGGPTVKAFNVGSGSYACWLTNSYGAVITDLQVYVVLAEDQTDVGTEWDLGDFTIPATEQAWSGVLKSACSLGTYLLTIDRIKLDTDVVISTVDLSTSTETEVAEITTGNISQQFTCKNAFDLMFGRSAPSLRQIRIGRYDGTNYGIGFSTDGGVTWTTALDFSGLNFDGEIVALRTQGGYIDIRNSQLSAGAGSYVNIQSGGAFTMYSGGTFRCQAGSDVQFVTDEFAVKNSSGKNMLAIGTTEDKEGQIILGDEGFPVNFTEDFVLPVRNGGTGYTSGQIHRGTGTPSAGLGIDGDMYIRYANSSGAYSAFAPAVSAASSKSSSKATYGGIERYWNNHHDIDNAIPFGTWAAGNDKGYAYGVYGTFTSPENPVNGSITLEMNGYKYYNNSSGLTAYIVDSSNAVLASASVLLPYRTAGLVTSTFTSVSLTANTNYKLLICDQSETLANTSKSYITLNSIVFPAYSGSLSCGLYIKSAGNWVTVFTNS